MSQVSQSWPVAIGARGCRHSQQAGDTTNPACDRILTVQSLIVVMDSNT